MKLTSLAAPSPAHRSAAASLNRRRPPLLAAGKPRPAVPKPIRPTTTLLSTSPSYSPPSPLVGGDCRRRNRPAPPSQRRLLCFGRPGTRLLDCKSSRDPSAISSFVFNCCCELLNSIKNHRKIRKMQNKFCKVYKIEIFRRKILVHGKCHFCPC